MKKHRINFYWGRDRRNTKYIYMTRGCEETHYTDFTSMRRAINNIGVKKMKYDETQIELT